MSHRFNKKKDRSSHNSKTGNNLLPNNNLKGESK
jgi:hypothetical protein